MYRKEILDKLSMCKEDIDKALYILTRYHHTAHLALIFVEKKEIDNIDDVDSFFRKSDTVKNIDENFSLVILQFISHENARKALRKFSNKHYKLNLKIALTELVKSDSYESVCKRLVNMFHNISKTEDFNFIIDDFD